MSQNFVIALVVIAVALVAFLLLRGGGGGTTPVAKPTGNDQIGVVSSAASAVEDVAGPLIGVDAHPDLAGPPDNLSLIKGLGPKAAGQLKLLGITRFAQLAALDTAQIASLDEQMGVFRGRLERDRWIEQARYLARGDTATFEREFGKLG